ncbi:glycerophosphodiester phosphodiesterase [Limosilactobacillus sp. RRLNB_1_1]|uniref:Glycerophosphodiester phosphodiesterase n=1 Tax=Limosilactobacillus albertensis TaxID=2759752 RepID=A0A7W3Y8V3_9LACO|nr:glycerophosphodiester phosphodiesterase [Limosilactobacillus albertensis]MBB1069838.1 glycerophosphodiester phosphodiesterase [Limosilactobacillus albertensis]MCD7117076.1 glycerophosphodiester phosphodiesterase [Limosilactobacillus albertensis]MCD7128680.1 glycerophosphodiester phosphodiesterase [Limosilactobacillus albertensis]
MKNAYRAFKKYSRQFRNNWLEYLMLFGGLDLVNQFAVIPFFRWITTFVLQAGEIPFVSYQNIIIILTKHPLVVISLVVELACLLIIVYGEFMLLLTGFREIGLPDFRWRQIFKETRKAMSLLNLGSLILLLGYFLLVIPFADIIFRTPLLAKIQIPQFIIDYLMRNGWLISGLLLFYVAMFTLGIRLILTMPLMAYQHLHLRAAIHRSWEMTSKMRWAAILGKIAFVTIITSAFTMCFYVLIYLLQVGLDLLPGKFPLFTAIFNLSILQLGGELLAVWAGTVILLVVVNPLTGISELATASEHPSRGLLEIFTLMLLVIGLTTVANNTYYLLGHGVKRPITISHRGVAEENGVQNTIPAMEKTIKLKPDYVEMDLHETKDHQFVVMHDENLKELAGINKAPHELTLKQLTNLTVRENGHYAKIASFDQYLAAAEKHRQKLLIEIKTTPYDSKQMLQNFNARYGKRILRDHDQVHSLDYSVVTGLKKINPQLTVLYIQPYNFGSPQGAADGYSMEYSTLNQDFITQAHWQRQPVYAWTVNESGIMKQVMYNHADGIITDNLGELNATIKEFTKKQSYANRILNYIIILPTTSGIEP